MYEMYDVMAGGLPFKDLFEDVPWSDTPDKDMDERIAQRIKDRETKKPAKEEPPKQ